MDPGIPWILAMEASHRRTEYENFEVPAPKDEVHDDSVTATLIDMHCHSGDTEADHSKADDYLLNFVRHCGGHLTAAAFERVKKWYA